MQKTITRKIWREALTDQERKDLEWIEDRKRQLELKIGRYEIIGRERAAKMEKA